jgi:hypothetical protein
MGYHIIIKKDSPNIIHIYKETQDQLNIELINNPEITPETIIYAGDQNNQPFFIRDHKKYNELIKDWYRAGLKAQDLFKQQAIERRFIVEPLSQDQESFRTYFQNANYLPIKRGDFLIRNVNNIEVDVKCRTFYRVKR